MSSLIYKLKNPNVLFSIIYTILSLGIIVSTIVLLALGYSGILMYLLYGISAITLSYLVYIVIYYTPKIRNSIIITLKKHKFTNELLESFGYRSLIFVIFSFILNITFAIFQGVIAILAHSLWYGALAIYYIALCLIRGGLVSVSKKQQKNKITLERQLKSYRNCGIYLILLNVALVGALIQMVVVNQTFEYAGLMIYVMATYTFYKLGLSIYNLVKAKAHKDFTIQSVKNIGFADALVSVLALQTALLQTFSPESNSAWANALTGGVISIAIISLGILMIVQGQIKLKNLQKEKKHE